MNKKIDTENGIKTIHEEIVIVNNEINYLNTKIILFSKYINLSFILWFIYCIIIFIIEKNNILNFISSISIITGLFLPLRLIFSLIKEYYLNKKRKYITHKAYLQNVLTNIKKEFLCI